tara:strand:- start:493 stop:2145 length:1653 start_codon:yes stop_codon:yes gene_type:complete
MDYIRQKVLICGFLIIATLSIYSEVKDHDFIIFDDDIYITNNLNVQTGFTNESVSWAFTKAHFGGWFPVTMLSFILDYELYGLNPKGYLLTNLCFHIVNSLLLFLVLFRMTGAIWQSAFVAAIFALHPLNVESVAWISERKNVLSTLFWLLTMWAYINYVEKPNFKTYSLVFLSFTLGLMSKSMLVTLPFALLLLDYWPLRRLKFGKEIDSNEIFENNTAKRSKVFRLIFEKIPLFLLATGLSIVTFIVFKNEGLMRFSENLTFSTRLTNGIVSYMEYLRKMLWPEKLAVFYPHPGNTLPLLEGILCGIALVGITIISIRLLRKTPYFAVGWFWYLGTLVPAIGIVQVGGQSIADHFTYIPLIGIFIIVAWGVPELISKWRYKEKLLSVSAGIIIFILMITTWKQVSHWKSSITIFEHAIMVTEKKYPKFAGIYNNLGIALYAKGENEEAISHYKMAIKVNPFHTKAYYNLGIAFFAKKKNEEAISYYKMAIKLSPNFTNAHYNLGLALVQKGQMKEAVHHFRETLRVKPDFIGARDYLEFALMRLQKLK